MKRKFSFFLILTGMVFALSACQLLNNGGGGGGYSYRPIGSKSNNDVPPSGDLVAIEPGRTYNDYIKNNVYPLSSTPTVGKANLLVIPIWFNDSATFINQDKKGNVRDDIEKAYFGKNTDTGWRSVKSYYEEESHGKLTLKGTVSNWYLPNKSYQIYKSDPDHSLTTSLVKEASDWFFSTDNPSAKRADYDCDKDGYLDGVILIYAAPDYSIYGGSGSSNLWAYCYWIQNPDVKNNITPGANVFFWASYDFMYGKNKAATRTGNNQYADGDTSNNVEVDAHTYIHEMGHMFGLEDYYDYSNYEYHPAGGFSMQDHNVGSHDPFSVFALGWGKAYVPVASAEINLKPFVTSGEMIVLSSNWNAYDSPFDEYLILEYYTNEGLNYFDSVHPYMEGVKQYPTGSQQSGIRLWHVDARLLYKSSTNAFDTLNANKITTDPKISGNKVTGLLTDNYNDGTISMESLSPLANRNPENDHYSDLKLLELVRNSTTLSYLKTKEDLKSLDLFKTGDTFSMSKYARQFVNGNKLNNGSSLGFSFTINALNDGYASISVTKS